MADADPISRLATESGRLLGELGVRPDDDQWIQLQADTIASLLSRQRRRLLPRFFYRLARKAARIAR